MFWRAPAFALVLLASACGPSEFASSAAAKSSSVSTIHLAENKVIFAPGDFLRSIEQAGLKVPEYLEQHSGNEPREVSAPFWQPSRADFEQAYAALEELFEHGTVFRRANNHYGTLPSGTIVPPNVAPATRAKLSDFGVQAVGVTLGKPRDPPAKAILLRGACQREDLATHWVIVFDGGGCFFEAAYEPQAKAFDWFEFDGGF